MRLIDADKTMEEIPIDVCDGFEVTGIIEKIPTVQAIPIPDNATNGDMMKAMLQVIGYTPLSTWTEEKRKKSGFRVHIKDEHKCDFSLTVSEDWWNAPYKRGDLDGSN